MSIFSSLISIFGGSDVYTNSETVDGELRETFAAAVDDHNVCVVRYNQDNDDVRVWFDTASRQMPLEEVENWVYDRLHRNDVGGDNVL